MAKGMGKPKQFMKTPPDKKTQPGTKPSVLSSMFGGKSKGKSKGKC